MSDPDGSAPGPPARVGHIYVGVAAVIAIVALIFGTGASGEPKQAVAADSERAQQYFGRLTTLGRGLVPIPVAQGVLPRTDEQTPLDETGHQTLSDGTNFELLTDRETRVTIVKVTVQPGAAIPYHIHSSPLMVVLVSGEVTDFRRERPDCAPQTLKPGDSIFEHQIVHTLVNNGSKPAVLYSVAWSAKDVAPSLIEKARPAGCPKNPN
jgi:quercetin dioxygenase-like cupin family protein